MDEDLSLRDALVDLAPQHDRKGGLHVIGLCGGQGAGKSTLAAKAVQALAQRGVAAAALSLDDLYLTRAERNGLAEEVHPLFRTRGVPGTHDVDLGLSLLAALDRGEGVRLPRFDKAHDDRAAPDAWQRVDPGLRVLLFEGWCVGARPQQAAALVEPINRFEAEEDPDGIWRRHANACLAGPYQQLFARLDRLVLLAAPSFDAILPWRRQQEQGLGSDGMDQDQLTRFVQHYERLTRHILTEMPGRADLVARLSTTRALVELVRTERPSRR